MRGYAWGAVLLAAGCAGEARPADGSGGAPSSVWDTASVPSNAEPVVLAAHEYGLWGARWWRWMLGAPLDHNPMLDATGEDCAIGQVDTFPWFLAGAFGGGVTRECEVPPDKPLFFPLVNVAYDYPCPPAFDFEPAPRQSLEDFLTGFATDNIDGVDSLHVLVDGEPIVDDPFRYRGTSQLHAFVGDPSLQDIDPCITGDEQVLVSDGYWMMLHPLPPGPHTIEFGGGITETDFSVSASYDIVVGH